jgi:hypothetical protein
MTRVAAAVGSVWVLCAAYQTVQGWQWALPTVLAMAYLLGVFFTAMAEDGRR